MSLDEKTILLVDDEPLILMDLEFACEDAGVECLACTSLDDALARVEDHGARIAVAVLDVSLGHGETCLPIARALDRRDVPYVIHSGDLDRRNEIIRSLDAPRIAKPSSSDVVIAKALALVKRGEGASPSAA